MEGKMGWKSMLQKVSSLLPDKEVDHECGNLYPLMKKKNKAVHWKYIIWFNDDDYIVFEYHVYILCKIIQWKQYDMYIKGTILEWIKLMFFNLFSKF